MLDTQPLLGQFAPTSNQSWLTITGVTGDVVSYSFTQNTTSASRTADIDVRGMEIAVTQSATTPPAMTSQPTSQTVNALSTVSFTAAASGTPTPTVQWYVNTNNGAGFTPISGATSTTLSFTATGDLTGDEYEAVFTNSAGSITTNAVTLTVNKLNATVTLGSLTPTYDGMPEAATATTSAAGTSSFTLMYNGSTTIPTAAGSYTVVNTNYQGSDTETLVIGQAPLSVVAANANDVEGQAAPTFTGTITGIQNSDPITATYSTTPGAANEEGSYAITPTLSDGGSGALANYSITITNGTFTVADAPLTAGALTTPNGIGNSAPGTWAATGSMTTARAFGSNSMATLLNNGQVLVAGGANSSGVVVSSAELYNPATGTWSATGSMNSPRLNATMTRLQNGEVLVAGGSNSSGNQSSAELYNPATGTWSVTGSMFITRHTSTATLLNNGEVLVSGGGNGQFLSDAELYNPATGTWTVTGSLHTARDQDAAILLNNGEVLIAGGYNGTSLSSVELYNPATGSWTVTGSLNTARDQDAAILLNNGEVLVAGGYNGTSLSSAELYTPAAPPVEGQAITNQTVFHFTDADPAGTASDYTAVVALGDGNSVTLTSTPSANGQIVADPNGGFDVQLSYTYPEYLTNATFGVTVTDAGGSTTSASTSTFSVADAPITAAATPVTTAVYGTAFSGEVATFTDGNPFAPLSDFPLANVIINWGDGTTSNATSVTETGTTFQVFGDHTYDAAGATANPLAVTITDVGGSVSNATSYTPTVAQAALTITANNASMVYGSTLPALSASYSGFVNGDTSANLTTQPTPATPATSSSPVGSYAITISGAVDPNYAITYVAGSLGVTPAALTITGNNASMVYGGVLPALSASYSGFVNGDTSASLTTAPTLSANAADHVGGANPITPAGAVDPDYAITYVPGTLTVTPAALVISGNSSSAYGASPILTASYFGLENGDTGASLTTRPMLTTTATSASHVGTYPVTISGAVDPDYVIGYQVSTLTVTPAALSITSNATNAYGTALPTLTAVYTGFVNGDTAAKLTTRPTFSTTATATSHVGSYPITISGAVDPNYTISYVTGTLTVTPAALKITANNAIMVYGAPLPALTASYSGFVNGDTVASLTTAPTLSANAASHVGTSPITASGAVDPDYTITYVAGKLTVTPAALVITANPSSMVYGAPLPILSANYSGFVNGDMAASLTVAPTLSASAADHVGGANPITASKAVDPDYSISYVSGTLTVTPASLVITANNLGNVYGSGLPGLTASYSGLVNGDTDGKLTTAPTLSTTAMASSPVGGYPITVSGAVDSDYTISYLSGTMSVTPAPLTITASNATMIYGAAVPTLTVSYKGFVNGDTAASLTTAPSLSTTATTASHVGGYTNTASGAAASNYSISYVAGTLTVNPKALTITASPASMVYGSSLPSLNVSYSGFVNGDTVASLTTAPTVSTTATAASPVGSYAITASGAQDNDYTIHYTTGTLSVTRASLTITADDLSRTAGDPAVVLTATYAGLMNGDLPAVVTGLTLASTGNSTNTAGTYAITAKGAAAANYTITLVNGTLTVLPATATHLVLSAPSKVYVNTPFQLVATAYNAYGNIATGYTGTVLLTRTYGAPVSYTFMPTDNGVHIFTVTVTSKGLDRFVVSDQNDGSIVGAELDRTF